MFMFDDDWTYLELLYYRMSLVKIPVIKALNSFMTQCIKLGIIIPLHWIGLCVCTHSSWVSLRTG